MKDNEKWIVTYGTVVESNLLKYPSICDYIEDALQSELRKCYPDAKVIEDSRDGETYSVRFELSSVPQLPKFIEIISDETKYELERLEMEPEKIIYPDKLRSLLDEYSQILSENRVPFDQLSLYFLFQAIVALEEHIFEGTVLLCRSAIENSLYLACVYRKNVKNDGDVELEMVLPVFFIDKKKHGGKNKIYWADIKKTIIALHILDETSLDYIYDNVMEKGNFAAHIAQREMNEYKYWYNKYKDAIHDILEKQRLGQKVDPNSFPPGYKLRTSPLEATSTLESTIKFLIELTQGYTNAYELL